MSPSLAITSLWILLRDDWPKLVRLKCGVVGYGWRIKAANWSKER